MAGNDIRSPRQGSFCVMRLARPADGCGRGHSRRVAGVGCDDAAKLAPPAYQAVAGGAEVEVQHVVPDFPPTMRALGVVMEHPGPQDVVELCAAEADEEIQTFALDGRDEGLGEGIGVGRPVRDLDDPATFRSFFCRLTNGLT